MTEEQRLELGRVVREWEQCGNADEVASKWQTVCSYVASLRAPLVSEVERLRTELGVAKARIVELESVETSFGETMDALGQIESICGSDQELEPSEVVALVHKTVNVAAPTEPTEEEFERWFNAAPYEATWRSVNDDLRVCWRARFRAARAGVRPRLREVTEDEMVALANAHLFVTSFHFENGDTRIACTFSGTTEFARAILAAAQGEK